MPFCWFDHIAKISDKEEARFNRKDPTQAEFVYLITCRDLMKIGTSRAPEARLMMMHTDNPFPKRLVGYIHGDRSTERRLHKDLMHLHVSGEWFKKSEAFIDAFETFSIRPAVSTIDVVGNRNVGAVTISRHTEINEYGQLVEPDV